MSFEPDIPAVVGEVREAFERYERALVERDLAAMADAFLPGDQLVRFGIADRQHGAQELANWRAAQPALPANRTHADTVISTFGRDVGIVTTCFSYPGRAMLGRQSQTWLRVDGAWKVINAHVSEIPKD